MRRLNPLTGLRARIAALVLGGVLVLAAVMISASAGSVDDAYERAARAELTAIATTWEDGFDASELADAQLMQERVQRLHDLNPHLTKIAVSWHDARGRAQVAEAGGQASGHEAEIRHPVGTDALLELHYDLAALDHARARDRRILALLSIAAALILGGLVSLLLGRTVVRRLDHVRAVANRLRDGDSAARTNLGGRDEIGALRATSTAWPTRCSRRSRTRSPASSTIAPSRSASPRSCAVPSAAGTRCRSWHSTSTTSRRSTLAGHAVGDEALRAVAAAVRDELRAGDVCGRVGGDEFILALVNADVATADLIVDRIRTRVETAFSAGIVSFPRHGTLQDELLHLAQGAMYWAKSHGKARTFVYSEAIDFALSAEEAAERNLRAGLVNTVHALARAVDAKDGYTHSHSQRVARYAAELGRALGVAEERLELLRTAGVLHDVGKIGIPDAVLLKPAKLDADEFAVMRRHSELGRDIIAGAGLEEIATWVMHLHERFDGRGYPDGLAAEAIPLESRILHCADALEAMTSSRIYRPGMEVERAVAELERGAGSQFDPQVAAVLVDLVIEADLLTDRTIARSHRA